MSNRKLKKAVIQFAMIELGFSKETAVLVARCHLRREMFVGSRTSEWYTKNIPAADYAEKAYYRKTKAL